MPQSRRSSRNTGEIIHLISSCILDMPGQRTLGLIRGLWAALISQTPETVSQISCSQEAKVQLALFTQWSTLLYRVSLTVNTTYCLLPSGEEVLPWLRWTRERAELFVGRSGTIKSLFHVSLFCTRLWQLVFNMKKTDLAQIHHYGPLVAYILARLWLHRSTQKGLFLRGFFCPTSQPNLNGRGDTEMRD